MARLRVAKPGDAPAEPLTITEALEAGPREVLSAMRYQLAKKLDAGEVSSNAIASAYKELRELDRQIRALDASAEEEERRRGSTSSARRRSFDASSL